jgi:hypothetical protein
MIDILKDDGTSIFYPLSVKRHFKRYIQRCLRADAELKNFISPEILIKYGLKNQKLLFFIVL